MKSTAGFLGIFRAGDNGILPGEWGMETPWETTAASASDCVLPICCVICAAAVFSAVEQEDNI